MCMNYSRMNSRTGKTLSSVERNVVLNVLKYFRKSYPDNSVDFAVGKTSEATTISKRSIYKFKSDQSKGIVMPAKKRRKTPIRSKAIKYDGFLQSVIRKVVHYFYVNNIPPTFGNVLKKVNRDQGLPTFKRTALYRLLKSSEFVSVRCNKNCLLIEKDDVIVSRHSYLRRIRECKRQNCPIVYVDETWVYEGQEINSESVGKTAFTSPKEAFRAGVRVSSNESMDQGPCFVIVHAGGENGFIKNAKIMFLADKKDCEQVIDGTIFEKWFKKQLLPNLQPNTAIVFESAPSNSVKVEKIPDASSSRDDLKTWLMSKNVYYLDDSLKRELLDKVAKVKHLYSTNRVDELAENHGCKVIRLPPYHYELNPIKFVWNQVKRHVAMHFSEFKADLMIPLIENAFDSVKVEDWEKYCREVDKTEHLMWLVDSRQDDLKPFIKQANSLPAEESPDSNDDDDLSPNSGTTLGHD